MSELFNDLHFTPEAQAYLREIEKNFKSDIAAPSNLFYSHETFEELSQTAREKLKKRLLLLPAPIELANLREAWHETVTDYYKPNNWGFAPQTAKPPKILTEDDKVRRELWPYTSLVLGPMTSTAASRSRH